MNLIECKAERHAEAMLAIFNDAIVNSTALYDYKPRTMASMTAWFEAKAIALHERMGFTHCGTIQQVGFKFGRWLDLAFYQLVLTTPLEPIDG